MPALTDMLIAIGARPQLVAVSSYDEQAEVKGLPRVGALIDPDVERIIALRPDLVLAYGSQKDLLTQLSRAAIPVFEYRHGGLSHIVATIRDLGARVGRRAEAETVAGNIERRIQAVSARTAAKEKPRVLLVFDREPGTLRGMFVSGGRGFLHDMLQAAGGVNVFADVQAESLQASAEIILTRKPDVIIELRATESSWSGGGKPEIDSWKAVSSVPAVRNQRVYLLIGTSLVVPGSLVADGVERMARVLHPELFK